MRDDLTAILMIIDRSGSMASLADDAVGGLNTYIEEQKKQPGEGLLTLVLFNHDYEAVYTSKPLKEIPALTTAQFHPHGNTALLDAIGRGIGELGLALSTMEDRDRPKRVVVVIITDGQENSSKEYKLAQIRGLVERQQKIHGWEIVFMGANIDAFAEAGAIGIGRDHTMTFDPSGRSVRDVYKYASRSVTSVRLGKSGKLKN